MTSRGLTFIEVIVSIAMLSIVSGEILSAVTLMETSAAHDRRRLEAMEVAHRVVLQHIDHADSLKALNGRYPYGDSTYLFEFKHSVLEEGDAQGGSRVSRRESAIGESNVESTIQAGLEQVTVLVYLESPDQRGVLQGRPIAELTRVYSPLFFFERDSARLIEWVTDIISGNAGQ